MDISEMKMLPRTAPTQSLQNMHQNKTTQSDRLGREHMNDGKKLHSAVQKLIVIRP